MNNIQVQWKQGQDRLRINTVNQIPKNVGLYFLSFSGLIVYHRQICETIDLPNLYGDFDVRQ